MTKYETDQIFKSRLQNEDDKTIAKRMSIKAKTIASYCYRNGLTDSNIEQEIFARNWKKVIFLPRAERNDGFRVQF